MKAPSPSRAWVMAAQVLGTFAFGSCRSELDPIPPNCTPNQFIACEHACGRGVQQCVEDDAGIIGWSPCACLILDAAGLLVDATQPDADAAEAAPADTDAPDAAPSDAER